jgi:uncharacterized membrane protein YdbT with pleckstrin-like domain
MLFIIIIGRSIGTILTTAATTISCIDCIISWGAKRCTFTSTFNFRASVMLNIIFTSVFFFYGIGSCRGLFYFVGFVGLVVQSGAIFTVFEA